MPESALVIVVPEAEPLVSDWRAQYDWSAQRGVPAHITLLYPFAPTEKVDGELLSQLRKLLIAEAAISFLGFGVQPPTPAWGSMLSEGRDFLYVAWWLAAWPGAALALTALGVNLVGDWLRDVLDPKLRI